MLGLVLLDLDLSQLWRLLLTGLWMLLLLLLGRVDLLAGCGLRHLSDLAIVLKHRFQL